MSTAKFFILIFIAGVLYAFALYWNEVRVDLVLPNSTEVNTVDNKVN